MYIKIIILFILILYIVIWMLIHIKIRKNINQILWYEQFTTGGLHMMFVYEEMIKLYNEKKNIIHDESWR